MAQVTSYGDISPAVAAYSVVRMLKRAMPYLHLEKFGQTYAIPTNSTTTAKFRRYFLSGAGGAAGTSTPGSNFFIPVATTPLIEGVTPSGSKLANQDYTVTLAQYGDYVTITDVIMDTHTDPVLQQTTDILGEQAALTVADALGSRRETGAGLRRRVRKSPRRVQRNAGLFVYLVRCGAEISHSTGTASLLYFLPSERTNAARSVSAITRL
jgi:N4-gp56 family major capsid protein